MRPRTTSKSFILSHHFGDERPIDFQFVDWKAKCGANVANSNINLDCYEVRFQKKTASLGSPLIVVGGAEGGRTLIGAESPQRSR
jgi:hypothetical protein